MRLTKFLLISLSFWLVGWLLYKNFVPSGRFEVVYNFEPNPFVSALRPPERLSEISKSNKSCSTSHVPCFVFQEITGDPVYFDLRLPSSFEKVEIDILHKHKEGQKFTIAAFTDRKNWRFITADTELRNPHRDYAEGLALHANFSTAGLDIVDRTITLILGAPEASIDNSITIYEIRALATKPPLKWQDMPKMVGRIIKNKFLNL